MDVIYSLKTENVGLYDDNVTIKRRPYIAIETVGPWLPYIRECVQRIMSDVGIKWTFVIHEIYTDSHYKILPQDMLKCIRLMESNGYKTIDSVPYCIIDHVTKSMVDEVTPDDIIFKIGEELWGLLRSFQKVCVQYCVSRKRVYIGDAMGSGKTLQSIAVCKYFEENWPVLIICPSILRNTWKNQLIKWLNMDEKDIFVVKSSKHITKSRDKPHKFLIISYSLIFKPEIQKYVIGPYGVVVLDECHYIKAMTSKRSSAAIKVIQQANIRILLSGTPFSYPSEMYQQIKALYSDIYPWFFNYSISPAGPGEYFYATRYCNPVQIRVRNTDQWMFKGYDNPEELNAVLSTFMIRRRKKDILPYLPSKTRTCIILDPLKKKEYQEIGILLKDESSGKKPKTKIVVDEYGNETEVEVLKNQRPDKFMKSFRLTCQYKIVHVINFIKQYIVGDLMKADPDLKILIFSHHTIMRNAVEECLEKCSIPFFSIYGSVSDKKRSEYEYDFQNTDKYRVGVLSIYAACTGLTLTKASMVIFTELLFGPDIMFQAEDRVHRIGQESNVNIFYLIEPKTTDDINWGLIKKKERESSNILDGEMNYVGSRRVTFNEDDHENILLVESNDVQKRKSAPTIRRFVTKRIRERNQTTGN